MKFKTELRAKIDKHGHLVLPPEIVKRYGLKPGDTLPVSERGNELRIRQPVTRLKKLYIEPTNQCNLSCRTCIRNTWDEPLGQMDSITFEKIINSLKDMSPLPTVIFGGFGEPLHLPDIAAMVAEVKSINAPVELITNGTLLHEKLSRDLMAAGIDVLWLSLDGATPESYADVRLGALLPEVIANVSRMRYSSWAYEYPQFHLGIIFVAMKRNIDDLPEVLRIGTQLKADRYIVTNVLPYTAELVKELLYEIVMGELTDVPSPFSPYLNISKIDMNDDTREALYRVIKNFRLGNHSRDATVNLSNYCPFIEKGAAAIAWDGSLSPCLALMHSHPSYLHDRTRLTRKHVIGNINNDTLSNLWIAPDYVELRTRVQDFDFSPCSLCGGCDLSLANEEDCFGNGFPTCGGCLWVQGVVQCP